MRQGAKPHWLHGAVAFLALFLVAGCQAASSQATPTPQPGTTQQVTPTKEPSPTATQPAAAPSPTAAPTTIAATATLAPALTSAPAAATPTSQPPTATPAQPAAGDPARGQQLFTSNCNACHPGGQQGVGPPLVGATERLSEDQITQIVRQGRGGMPPVGSAFTQQQVADLLAYLKTLR